MIFQWLVFQTHIALSGGFTNFEELKELANNSWKPFCICSIAFKRCFVVPGAIFIHLFSKGLRIIEEA